MKVALKDFIKNLKNYIDYILKLGFKELFINFIEIIILVVLSCLVYVPVGLVRDLLYQIISLFSINNVLFFKIYNIIFNLISAIIAICLFIYMFNRRYSNIDDIRKKYKDVNRESKNEKENVVKANKDEFDNFDLPKKKEM